LIGSGTEQSQQGEVIQQGNEEEDILGFGKGALLWMLGIPLPIILLLALFWR